MRVTKYINSALTIILCLITFTTGSICTNKATADTATPANTGIVSSLDIVNSPHTYLNKKVVIKGKFDKFTTLGLDYKTALRSSEKYISFLIKRDDSTHDIPLSEMKLFLKRELAEKYIDLKTNDEISINGTVFSDALGDAWVDVEQITILKKAPEQDGVKK